MWLGAGTRPRCWCTRAAQRPTTTWVRLGGLGGVREAWRVDVGHGMARHGMAGQGMICRGVAWHAITCHHMPSHARRPLLHRRAVPRAGQHGAGDAVLQTLKFTFHCFIPLSPRRTLSRTRQYGAGDAVLPGGPQRAAQLPAGKPSHENGLWVWHAWHPVMVCMACHGMAWCEHPAAVA